MTAAAKASTTRTVTANSLWYGLDSALSVLMVFLTSIPLARTLGPERLGYFNYVQWLCSVSGGLGSLGIPATASRFMASYISRAETGMARAVFGYALRMQAAVGALITGVGLLLVFVVGDPTHRLTSALQVAYVFPAMMTQIATWANISREKVRDNVQGGIISDIIYLTFVFVTLTRGWDLPGIAAGMLVAKTVDCAIRFRSVHGWMRHYPRAPLPTEAKTSMFRFAGQQLYMALLGALLWDKSDVILLKALSSDVRQVTFFTLAYNVVEKVVLLPQVIASSMSISLVAKGHDPSRAATMTGTAVRYLFLFSAPLLFGLYLVSGPAVRVLYGSAYIEAGPILAAGALFAIIKPLVSPFDALFRVTGRQARMLVCATICTVVNIGLDLLLIPRYGAVGAAVGNGAGQFILVLGYVVIAVVWFGVKLEYGSALRTAVSAGAMALPALFFNRMLPAPAALACDVIAGAVIFALLLRITGVLEARDMGRIRDLSSMLPSRLQPGASRLTRILFGRLDEAEA